MSDHLPAEDEVTRLARDLIRIPSLTAIRPDLRGAASAAIAHLRSYLEAAGARCEWLSFEGGNERWGYPVDNLYAEWGDGASAGGLCFIGHTDVVPPGDLSRWSANPFSGHVAEGFLHGRGATDMKGAVAAFAVAVAGLARTGALKNAPPLALLITADEEWAAINGTRRVLEWMRVTGRQPSAFIVGEPSSPEVFGSAIKIGRRGSLCGTLKAVGVQGHAAYPELFVNPNHALVQALEAMHGLVWNDGGPGLPPTNFETIALRSGDFGATAIVPGEAEALWNIRFTHKQTPLALNAKLQNLLDNSDGGAKDHACAKLLCNLQLTANLDTAAMPYFSPPGALAALARSVIAAETEREPQLDAEGGTTDGRFIYAFFPQAEIIEFGLPEAGGLTRTDHPGRFGRQGGMHQADECCALADLAALEQCYRGIITSWSQLR